MPGVVVASPAQPHNKQTALTSSACRHQPRNASPSAATHTAVEQRSGATPHNINSEYGHAATQALGRGAAGCGRSLSGTSYSCNQRRSDARSHCHAAEVRARDIAYDHQNDWRVEVRSPRQPPPVATSRRTKNHTVTDKQRTRSIVSSRRRRRHHSVTRAQCNCSTRRRGQPLTRCRAHHRRRHPTTPIPKRTIASVPKGGPLPRRAAAPPSAAPPLRRGCL